MAYQFLKYLFKLSQYFYFKRIEVVGQENIPKNEANIFVSNHPSAFKDPILVSVNLPQTLFYIAAEEFMGPPKIALFLERNFNIIPIYRPQTRRSEIHKNTDSFRKCHEVLSQKKSIVIYAEGFSETQSWLSPIKSGTARIAFEALQKHPELDKVNIISMGYNYSNPHEFRSTFLLNIGESFEIKQNSNLRKKDVSELAHQHIQNSMNALDSNEFEWQEVLQKIKRASQLNESLVTNFNEEKIFIESLNALKSNQQEQFISLKKCVIELQDNCNNKNLNLNDLIKLKHPKHLNFMPKFINGILILPGLILNFVPLVLTNLFVKNREFKYSFEGAMYFGFGTLFTFLWYLLIATMASFTYGWYSLLIPLPLLLTAYISLKSWDILRPSISYNRLASKVSISNYTSQLFDEVVKKADDLLK